MPYNFALANSTTSSVCLFLLAFMVLLCCCIKSLAPIPESEDESLYHDEDEDVESTTLYKVNKKNVAPLISPEPTVIETRNPEKTTHSHPQGWEAIPKPKGHSGLDYSRWDSVEDDSSEEEEDETEEQQPQYRFRVRTVGVRSVK